MGLVITAVGLLFLFGLLRLGKASSTLTGSEHGDFNNTSQWDEALDEANQDDLDLR